MVAVCRSKRLVLLHDRSYDLVDVGGAVEEVCVLAGDEITYKYKLISSEHG